MTLRPRSSFFILFFVLTSAANVGAQTITFELRNGDRLSGQIVSENSERVVISNAWNKELALPLAEISKRVPVATTAAAPASPKTNAVAIATPKPPPAKPTGATAGQPVKAKGPKYWHGDLQVGTDLTYSEKNRQVFHSRFKITYAKERFKNIFEHSFTYGRTDGVMDANRMDGAIKADYDLTKRIYIYNAAAGGYDKIRRIDHRYELGPGVGYHLITLTNFVLNTEAGLNYAVEDRADGTELEQLYYRLGENLTWKINTRFSFDQKLEYLPRVEDPDIYRVRFESILRYWLLQNISLNVSVLDMYDSKPPRNVTKNDLQIRSSIGVKF